MTRLSTTSSSSTTKRPSIEHSAAPWRTTPLSARPPTSSSMASTRSVLPAPVSPVSAVMPGTEHEDELVDDPEVANGELGQHGSAVPRQRSLRPNFAFRMRWKLRRPNVTSRALRSAGEQSTMSPSPSSPTLVPSTDNVGGTVADHLEAERLARIEHQRAVEQHVRRHRGEHEGAMARATRSAPAPTASMRSSRSASRRSARRPRRT